jgi:FkbM family methyltransferase
MERPKKLAVLAQLHSWAWRSGLDVLPVAAESRGLRGMHEEDIFRLQGVLQRLLGYSRGVHDPDLPEWLGLVVDALSLAEGGTPPRSQFFQDVWVLRSSERMRDGFFVEIGAADGLYVSNSYLLETTFGWNGVLCEPNPSFARAIRALGRDRSVLFEKAVTRRSGETVTLSDDDERSAVTSQSRRGVVHVATISPTDLMRESQAPPVIDYMSVDTEGSEPEILRAFPWRDHRVRFITVEHNHVKGRTDELDSILLPLGYDRVLQTWSGVDAWYVHRDGQVS